MGASYYMGGSTWEDQARSSQHDAMEHLTLHPPNDKICRPTMSGTLPIYRSKCHNCIAYVNICEHLCQNEEFGKDPDLLKGRFRLAAQ